MRFSNFMLAALVTLVGACVDSSSPPSSPDDSDDTSSTSSPVLQSDDSAQLPNCNQFRCTDTNILSSLRHCVATCATACVMDCS